MKIALLVPANIYFCPYINIYINILQEKNLLYDVIYWDKDELNEQASYVFRKPVSARTNKLKKIWYYLKYNVFLKSIIKENNYSKIIIFGPQIGIFLYSFLRKHYRNSFIFDYRDLSIEQYFKRTFNNILSISSLNIISSPGFKKCLPERYKYIISHNCNIQDIELALQNQKNIFNGKESSKLTILTIGAIRDYEQNIEIINALRDNKNFELYFVGKGPASDRIQEYVINNNIQNVRIIGFYTKNQEADYILMADFLNVYYPRKLSHDTALSNRFYNSIIYGVPMITTKDTTQGNYVDEYGLGIAIKDTHNLSNTLLDYFNNFDQVKYNNSRKALLKIIREDYYTFRTEILKALF